MERILKKERTVAMTRRKNSLPDIEGDLVFPEAWKKGQKGKVYQRKVDVEVLHPPFQAQETSITSRRQNKSKVLQLSPPQGFAVGSGAASVGMSTPANISVMDFSWDEESARSVKKPKEDVHKPSVKVASTPKDLLRARLLRLMVKMDKEARSLQRLAKENKNTKVEIKDLAERLSSTASQLMARELQTLLEGLAGERTREEAVVVEDSNDAETQTVEPAKVTTETATQTDVETIPIVLRADTDRSRELITSVLGQEGTYDDLEQALNIR